MSTFYFEHDSICRSCTLGKNLKKSFTSSDNRSKGILELINFDVCGPMSTPCLSRYLYYVVFIDDFLRNSWIYFLKAKSEIISKFKEFKSLVESETRKNIRALRYDNGGEFESHAFNDFCSDARICR